MLYSFAILREKATIPCNIVSIQKFQFLCKIEGRRCCPERIAQQRLPNEDDPTPSDPESVSSEPSHKALIINMDEGVVEDLTHDFIGTAESTTVTDDLWADFNWFKDSYHLRPKRIECDTVNIEDSTEVVDQVDPKASTVRPGRHPTLVAQCGSPSDAQWFEENERICSSITGLCQKVLSTQMSWYIWKVPSIKLNCDKM